MTPLPAAAWRVGAIEGLSADVLDVLVVGGGIVGSGVARDAAMRGIKTGLIDRHDFAWGTSSRSSRLLHGGMRYLAQGRIGLVREASIEKRVIHHIAPHLAAPLAFVFPTYRGDRYWKLWKLRIGVKIYDALCGWKNLGRSEGLSREAVEKLVPGLQRDGLTGAVRYFDGLTSDARLVLDTLRSASRHGANLCSHVRLTNASREGQAWRCDAVDQFSGRHLQIRARWVVNAGGPWATGLPNSVVPLRLTKGVHIVVEREKLPVPDAVVMTEGRRILFVIPWGRRTIVGTTDTDFTGAVEDVRCEPADVAYLTKVVSRFFPQVRLSSADVRSAWAGLRPLVADDAANPSDASRSHVIRQANDHWLEVAGGKLTTYRLMAEQTVDRVAKDFRHATACTTAEEPLVSPSEAAGISEIVPADVSQWAVEHYCRNEWALSLEDVMIRRSGWHYYVDDPTETACDAARWMAPVMGWSAEQREVQLTSYRRAAAATWREPEGA